ncbi:MAG: family 16 glycoside hydrolase [Planctomycetota bacterium]|jgi:hypothetical protein
MRIIKLVKVLLIVACVCIYGYSAISLSGGEVHNISIDTGKPLSIIWPFEISIVGDEGERGLRIGPKIGRGWRGEAGGEAGYRFFVPEDGRYYIWTYAKWFDECANAVFATIDDLDKAILGNDPIYKQWHWVRGFDVRLSKGTHDLLLSNHSDHISILKVFLTNSPSVTPEGCDVVFSDIFYDGFDGCDQGNFGEWQAVAGKWGVFNPVEPMCLEENVLVNESKGPSFLIRKGDSWSGYTLDVAVKAPLSESPSAAVGVCFALKDPDQHHLLQLRCGQTPGTAKMQLARKAGEKVEVLAEAEIPWEPDKWHHVEISLNPDNIEAKIDDSEPTIAPTENQITGGIGLHVDGEITAHFDDVHVRQIMSTN